MVNDPNDFAQLLATLIPLMFIFWQPKRLPRNLIRVIIPVALPCHWNLSYPLARCTAGVNGNGTGCSSPQGRNVQFLR